MNIAPVSVNLTGSNAVFTGKKKKISHETNRHKTVSSPISNTVKAIPVALVLSMMPMAASAQSSNPQLASKNQITHVDGKTNSSSTTANPAPVEISSKTILSENFEMVEIKTVNRKGKTDGFDEIRIKYGNDKEGWFAGFGGNYLEEIDVYTHKTISYKDNKVSNYINELLKSKKNQSGYHPTPGIQPEKHVNIKENPQFKDYVELASRQFSDDEGNQCLINLYNTKGDSSYFNKAMLYVLIGDEAAGLEVTHIDDHKDAMILRRQDGTSTTLKHADAVKYLKYMGGGGKYNSSYYLVEKAYTIEKYD